jgi:hypothetical protein
MRRAQFHSEDLCAMHAETDRSADILVMHRANTTMTV